jgi:hypothetical protein
MSYAIQLLVEKSAVMLQTSSGLIGPRGERDASGTAGRIAFVHHQGLLPGVLLLVLSVIWIGVPLRTFTTSAEPIPGLGRPGALVAFAIGAGFALWSLAALTRRRKIVIDERGVVVRDHRLGGVREWRAPLADYLGIQVQSRTIRTSRGRKLLHSVELRHDDPDRTLVLATSRDGRQAVDECRALARSLGLRQLEDSGTGAPISPDRPDRSPGDADPKASVAEAAAAPAQS